MTKDEVVAAVEPRRKGAYVNLEYEKVIPTKEYGLVRRITNVVVRTKIGYTAMKCVAKSSGTAKLPGWLEWDPEHNYLLNYIGDNEEKKGSVYLRVSLSQSACHNRKVKYICGGRTLSIKRKKDKEKISKLETINLGHPTSVMNIDIKNILKIGK